MLCQLCDEEEAFLTLIPTGGDGMPQTVGPRCFALIGLQTAKDNLPAEEIAAALGPMFVTPAREDLHEGAAKRRRRSKSALDEVVESGQQVDDGDEGPLSEVPAKKPKPPKGPAEGEAEVSAPAANE